MKIYWPNHWKIWKQDFALVYIGYSFEGYPDDDYVYNYIIVILGLGINFAFKRKQRNAKSN